LADPPPKIEPNYIDAIASRIHFLTQGFREVSDITRVLYRMYAVLALAKGLDTTAKDVHDAWSAWTAASDPTHRSLVPFDQLRKEVQDLDQPYVDAIHQVVREGATS
jgi:hypothetical protein